MLSQMLHFRRRERHDRDQRQQQAEGHDEGGRNRRGDSGKRWQHIHADADAIRMPIQVNVPENPFADQRAPRMALERKPGSAVDAASSAIPR